MHRNKILAGYNLLEEHGLREVGSATGKQPRTVMYLVTKTGITLVFMRAWLQSPAFQNHSRNGKLKARKIAFTVTYGDNHRSQQPRSASHAEV